MTRIERIIADLTSAGIARAEGLDVGGLGDGGALHGWIYGRMPGDRGGAEDGNV